MSVKKLNLDQTIFEIKRKLKAHIGSNGAAHLPVSDDAAGFMSVEEHKQLKQLFNGRQWCPDGTDILTLEAGFYEGAKFINHPVKGSDETSWISIVDVYSGLDGRRLIRVTDNMQGFTWYRTIHTGGDPNTGTGNWVRLHGEVVLWEGFSKLNNAVTLAHAIVASDGTDYYDNIKVVYQTDEGDFGFAYGSKHGVTISATNNNDDASVVAPSIYEAQLSFPTSQTAIVNRNVNINFYQASNTGNAAYMHSLAGSINIVKIVGVK